MCAPEIGPSMVISTNSMAPVAILLPSSATASFPADSYAAMIPEPITAANRKKEPSPSAASRRPSAGSSGAAVGIERIAFGPDRPDEVEFLACSQRKAEPSDVDIDGAELDFLAVRPHRFQELLA